MFDKMFLLLLLALAIIVVFAKDLKQSVIYLGMFSLVCAILFLVYGSPDLAIAEAVIGGGLSTILYLIAMKQADHFTVCVITGASKGEPCASTREIEAVILEIKALLQTRNLTCIVKYSENDSKHIDESFEADLAMYAEGETVILCGLSQEHNLDLIEQLLESGNENRGRCRLYRLSAIPETDKEPSL